MARPAGSPNKLKVTLMARLDAKYPGWHPVVQMADIANDESLSVQDRFAAAKEVAKYVVPQLKAVEHRDGDGNSLAPMFAMVLHGKAP